MKIAYLDFIYEESQTLEEIVAEMRKCADPGTQIDYICLEKTENLDYIAYEAMLFPDIMRAVSEISTRGYDAVIIGCCLDPCVNALRELFKDIVIVGPFEASASIAKQLGNKFSVIATRSKAQLQYLETIHRTGCENSLASIKYLGLKVMELQLDQNRLHLRMREAIREAIEEDYADVIILACTMETGQYKSLQEEFGVPVIDPTVAALKQAEMMVSVKNRCNWSVSCRGSYETPPMDEFQKFMDKDMQMLW